MELKPYDLVYCKIKQRTEFEGRKQKPETIILEGREYMMEVLWLMDSEDPYPGEYALSPANYDDREQMLNDAGIVWIASGDVEFLRS